MASPLTSKVHRSQARELKKRDENQLTALRSLLEKLITTQITKLPSEKDPMPLTLMHMVDKLGAC